MAPHLRKCTKYELGLPSYENATEQQRQHQMCYKTPSELYNSGQPFKITLRDERGIMVTILADNYFGTYIRLYETRRKRKTMHPHALFLLQCSNVIFCCCQKPPRHFLGFSRTVTTIRLLQERDQDADRIDRECVRSG